MEWMKELEEKISQVATELAELRKKNRTLVAKVKRLERQAKERPAEGGGGDWSRERAEVRRRVSQLATTLESLAGQD
jgi:predicted  nucleic acid-binding Zn-ribbon protein